MKRFYFVPARCWFYSLLLVAGVGLTCRTGVAADTNAVPATNATAVATAKDDEGDKAWEELMQAVQPPEPPMEWRTGEKQPSTAEIIKFRMEAREFVTKAADKARDFYARFPKHPKAIEARKREFDLLSQAVQMGSTDKVPRLEAVSRELLKETSLSEDERFEIRNGQIQIAYMGRRDKDPDAAEAEYEKDVRGLQKEFPKRPEVWQMLLESAANYDGEKGRPLLNEIIASSASDEVKAEAKGLLKKLDALGKPLNIKFAAVDGREVDIAKLKGKVVLVDFWATWCGPCVQELPNVKATYDKLHPKGFEIVGISFDQDKTKLEKFVADKKMEWPQFFDGKGWQNKFGEEFGIHSIPSMWLVDKKGVLRELEAREDLASKVEKYLAE